MSTAQALVGLAGLVGLVITRVVRSELPWLARDALRTGTGKRWLMACRVATWDVYAAAVVAVAGLLIVAEQWEKDTALTAVVVGLVIGVVGGLIVERRTGSAVSYWNTVEATLQEAVDDPLTREAQRAEFNVQRNRFTSGPSDEREDVIEAILRK